MTKAFFIYGVIYNMEFSLKGENVSLTEILKRANPNDIIYLDDKTYQEKITITTPNLTLIGSPNTKITYACSNGTIIPDELGGDGIKNYGTTGSATVIVKESAKGFKAIGITFENSFDRLGQKNGQAVAFKSECSDLYLKDCSFISYQDTLYIDFGVNNVVEDCYICGDVDFIFGSADCRFKNCQIKALAGKGKEAYFTAPSTLASNKNGFSFEDCIFAKEDIKAFLGRAWFPSIVKDKIYPRIKFINCVIPKDTTLALKQMHENDPTEYSFILENCKLV